MIGYFACVLAGIVLAALAARWQRDTSGVPPHDRALLALAAVLGAIAGAYGLELPADLLGWSASGSLHAPAGLEGGAGAFLQPMGHTVLGGLLGGWVAVEALKRRLRITQPTGDTFALPLALALGCGRLGCALAGCCAGVHCQAAWWAWHDAQGGAHVPVQAIEATFHFAMAAWLAGAARRGFLRGRRLALYVTLLAVLRFVLEIWRQHPRVLLGMTWYQILALALALLAGGTLWRRSMLLQARPLRASLASRTAEALPERP